MRPFIRTTLVLLIAGLAVSLFAGCGHAPTAPEPAAMSASTPTMAAPQSTESSGLISTVGSLVGDVVNLLIRTLNIIGSIGGTLTNGRWKVAVPAGAIDGDATISIGVTSTSAGQCELGISPADKNHFAKPVTLTIDCSSVSSTDLAGYVIRWWDPVAQKWVAVAGSTVDLKAKTVSAPLAHFSSYSVGPDPDGGKAGW